MDGRGANWLICKYTNRATRESGDWRQIKTDTLTCRQTDGDEMRSDRVKVRPTLQGIKGDLLMLRLQKEGEEML